MYFDLNKVLIIAEAGVNHNGDLKTALKLCDKAKECGADVIKFQTWKTEILIKKNVAQADYQKENTKNDESQYDMLKKLELSYEDFRKIKEYCDKIGIIFSSTADEEVSLDFLVNLGVPFLKVGSGEVGNIPFLRKIGSKKMPVILSTGMSSLAEVELSLNTLKDAGAEEIVLLHCTTSYPAQYETINLKAMNTLQYAFKTTVGYSDHSLGSQVAIAAVALGAKVIEKHFTLDKNMPGPDHKASLNPEELTNFINDIRIIEKALGDGIKKPRGSEQKISKVVKKRICALKPIKKDEIITEDSLCVRRSEDGLLAIYWDLVVGSKAKRDFNVDEGVDFD